MDILLSAGVLQSVVNFFQRSLSNSLNKILHILLFEVFDRVEHIHNSVVEVSLKRDLLIGQEVDESPLFDELIFLSNRSEFDLLLSGNDVAELDLFNIVGPLGEKLLEFVIGVDIVEVGEFGSQEVSIVSDLIVAYVHSNEELVVEE